MNISPIPTNIPSTFEPQLHPLKKLDQAQNSDRSFGSLLTEMVEKVDGMRKSADASVVDVVTGRSADIHSVAVKVQEAGIAFDLMMGVRNRLMDAYNELIKMQP
jgi:flagellar hook-basal body complex protein FliE